MEPTVLTAQCIADRLGISVDTVYRAVREGELEAMTLPGRHVLFTQDQLDAYVAKRRQQGRRDGDLTPADGVRVVELAELAHVKPQVIRNWNRRGKLRAFKVTGRLLVTWDEAARFLRARGVDAAERLAELRAEKAGAVEAA